MELTDKQIMQKLIDVVLKLYGEKRITEAEANRIIFYGLYNNECYAHVGIDDLDED